MDHTIKIIGEARLFTSPDKVKIIIHISNLSKEYMDALQYVEKAEEEMENIVKKSGFSKTDLKTLTWSITTEYEQRTKKDEQVRVFVGYRYRHKFEIEMEIDHKVIGKILNEIMHSSLTPEVSLRYFVTNVGVYKDKLLVQAVQDARRRAEVIAKADNMQIGKLISMEYRNNYKEQTRGINDIAVPAFLTTFHMPDITPANIELVEEVIVIWELC